MRPVTMEEKIYRVLGVRQYRKFLVWVKLRYDQWRGKQDTDNYFLRGSSIEDMRFLKSQLLKNAKIHSFGAVDLFCSARLAAGRLWIDRAGVADWAAQSVLCPGSADESDPSEPPVEIQRTKARNPPMNIVTVHNLKKYFGKGENQVKALDGIDLEIEKGKFTAIIGASGSGKTTLLNMIGGMDIPDEGEVIVDGVNLRGLKEKELAVFRRSKVGFVYQNFNLVPTLTVKENILFPLSLAGSTPDPAFFDEIVELLHLKERLNAFPNELSGGGQQRVAIARALIAKPAILLADEPTGNLDSKTGQNVLGLLKLSVETYRQTLVMITHNLELAQMADRVVRIEDGRIRG